MRRTSMLAESLDGLAPDGLAAAETVLAVEILEFSGALALASVAARGDAAVDARPPLAADSGALAPLAAVDAQRSPHPTLAPTLEPALEPTLEPLPLATTPRHRVSNRNSFISTVMKLSKGSARRKRNHSTTFRGRSTRKKSSGRDAAPK